MRCTSCGSHRAPSGARTRKVGCTGGWHSTCAQSLEASSNDNEDIRADHTWVLIVARRILLPWASPLSRMLGQWINNLQYVVLLVEGGAGRIMKRPAARPPCHPRPPLAPDPANSSFFLTWVEGSLYRFSSKSMCFAGRDRSGTMSRNSASPSGGAE